MEILFRSAEIPAAVSFLKQANGMKIQGTPMKVATGPSWSVTRCALECARLECCASFSHSLVAKTCLLHGAASDDAMVTDEKYLIFRKNL